MRRKIILSLIFGGLMLLAAACVPVVPTLAEQATPLSPDIPLPAPTTTTAPLPMPSPTTTTAPLPVPTPTASAQPYDQAQWIAYIREGQLLLTDVSGGVAGETRQFSVPGGPITGLSWSPTGDMLALTAVVGLEPRLFLLPDLNGGQPQDLGTGSSPGWSPDGRALAYIAGTFPDDNIWMTALDQPAPRQLTFERNFAWGAPVFTPDGSLLVVAGVNRDMLGASGNTSFALEYLMPDGSGTRTAIPDTQANGRLPYDLRFSSDGSRFAYSLNYHYNACASPGVYRVGSLDGSLSQDLTSPALQAAVADPQTDFIMGMSYAWSPDGSALAATGLVMRVDMMAAEPCRLLAGPQLSLVGLDGSEQAVIPGQFYDISLNRDGQWIAAARHAFPPGLEDQPVVEIYSAESGELVLSLGAGERPAFQP